ncbi:GNAT family N-acetyltransferase [Sphingomonas astaxanthinifaciens]|uniref:N-acetyltransferase domain-containing protein n=1 Tax=Sphingomonas astaxanthinifaciens DSM 22298 TaxID=1123267 RepID=A0ABQ5Z4T2_9SPHN|nr:GNAT family N-acetyltransferase [Sphingomonas astaxanthinifaciens]GLR46969.1 hypothetical protein GCM10007925_06800 [Sphingomonas astaxanthinifaciens DSM 22298]
MAQLRKPARVEGKRLKFEPVTEEDAEFILSLRLDERKNQHLSATAPDLEAQKSWLRSMQSDESQVYFLIKTMDGTPVGTVRVYDPRGDLFCWGSWILAGGAPPSSAVESTVMIYGFGLACGFEGAYFDVRKANTKVWQYHERWGATRTAETEQDYHYEIHRPALERTMPHYASRLPAGVRVVWDA